MEKHSISDWHISYDPNEFRLKHKFPQKWPPIDWPISPFLSICRLEALLKNYEKNQLSPSFSPFYTTSYNSYSPLARINPYKNRISHSRKPILSPRFSLFLSVFPLVNKRFSEPHSEPFTLGTENTSKWRSKRIKRKKPQPNLVSFLISFFFFRVI